jgi:hypothetical protein
MGDIMQRSGDELNHRAPGMVRAQIVLPYKAPISSYATFTFNLFPFIRVRLSLAMMLLAC